MDKHLTTTALSALALPLVAAGSVPDWLRLVPNGRSKAYDGRGPYFYEDARHVIANSFGFSPRIHIDVNHSTESAAKLGAPSEAQGYIVEMQERDDGIWGRVDWNPSGAALMSNRSYWGASPVLLHDKAGKIIAIKSLALVNDPALRALTALSAQSAQKETLGMEFLMKLAEILGLGADASEDDVSAAIKKLIDADAPKEGEDKVAQAALASVRSAFGLTSSASVTELVATATALQASQTQVAQLSARLDKLTEDTAQRDADAWVQSQLQAGAGIPAGKEITFADLYKEDPARAAEVVGMMPKLGRTGLSARQPQEAVEVTALSADQQTIADTLGIPQDKFLAQLQAEAKAKETA
ncbi:hypothetical protein J4E08_10050 [Sagittula sp. NFXS13]|uniref:phage protease n=1 Tax=Sagittula sp. NFXS13 TaxID=2819095 RepID=UPI0032DE4B52